MQDLTLQQDGKLDPRRVRVWLAVIVLAALALRCFNTLARTETVDRDTASFLYQAKSLVEGDAHRWFAVHTKPPVYSGLIAAGWKLGLDPILAGRLVALIAGLLVLHPTWLLLRRCGPVGPALVGLAILALMKEPMRCSGRCIADTTYAAIMMYGVYFFIVRGLVDAKLWAFPLAGAFGGLAYLTRTEGLMLLPLGLLMLAAGAIRRKLPRPAALLGGLAMLVVCLAIVSVHVAMVSAVEGRFTLRRNMGQFMLYSIGATHEVIPSAGKGPTALEVFASHGLSMAASWLTNLWGYLSSNIARCGGYATGAFLLAGLASFGRRLWRWQPCQLGLGLFALSLCVLSIIEPHTRMLLATIPLTGFLMGAGVFWIHRQADKLNLPGKGKRGSEMVIPAIAIGAVLAISAASVIKFDSHKDSPLHWAAAIIAADSEVRGEPAGRVASSESVIAWHARGEPVTFSDNWTLTTDQLREFVERQKVDFFVLNVHELQNAGLDDQDIRNVPAFLEIIGEARSDPRSRDAEHLLIYRVRAER
ncbi:MAG: glycosyltransferase family 39 protein [Phycisphaerae bacterium]|nr:glycosyltransferase family 39 protein [Phycisphaerae bacterium]